MLATWCFDLTLWPGMQDQVDGLRERGIKAARIDSSQTTAEYQEVIAELLSGQLKLLYVAPER